MTRSLPNFGVPVLFLSLLVVTACNQTQSEFSLTGPAPLVAAASIDFDVEPASVKPEFFHSTSCVGGDPFGVRLGIRVRGGHDVILRGLQFFHLDRFGNRSLPDLMPIPNLSSHVSITSNMPSTSPISVPGVAPLPGATVIAIPSSSPIRGVVISAGSSRLFPFFAKFGCGVLTGGVIVIVVDAGDRDGKFTTSELRVRVD